jgi:hypothetical protein
MKRLMCATLVGVLVGGSGVAAARVMDAKPKQKHARDRGADPSSVAIHVTFSTREVQVIRQHYAPRYRNLPPGLRKKLARTGQLPPGWQKKMEPFPVGLERQLVVLPQGYQRGVMDGNAIIYNPRSRVIIDAVVLF